ncbi:hypothetical protein UA08_03944 [Talaromyces atroroseus]|uniref:Carrier domain-containing protein n=1 Tax=Talaromyces atroroseus TaxID=1441469 RepID=A0A1Q5Q8X9_TALAT|nr:hypothetical protein UA08_03944 [Talaromyces atroroseus]OKL60565.1 hypothetical protein UA08_03944 [Talaromyces atroroseus]
MRLDDSHSAPQSTHVAMNKQPTTRVSSVLKKEEQPKQTEMHYCLDRFSLLDNIRNVSIADIRQKIAFSCGIQASLIEDAFPCTPLQESLLASSAHLPGYNVAQYKLRLPPDVDDFALHATWSHVYATTPILRTRIVDLAGQGLVQAIIDEPFEWTTADDLDEYLHHDSQRTTGTGTPLTRFALVRDSKRKQRFFVWTIHHALYDFSSLQLVLRKVNDVHMGKQPASSASFQNFIKHIRDMDVSYAERTWKQHLDGNEAQIYPPLPNINYRPKADQTLSCVFKELPWSRKAGTQTMPMVWAAWAVLMGQYAAEDEAVFGVTTLGRQANLAGIEIMTGPTMATIPLKVELDKKSTVTELVGRLQQSVAELAPVEHYGLQRIRKVSSDAERACEFQTLVDVNLQEEYLNPKVGPFDPNSLENVSASDNAQNGPLSSTVALKVQFKLLASGLDCKFTFDSRILGRDDATSLQRQLEHVLRKLCDPRNADLQLSDCDWTAPSDLERIWTWNKTVPQRANDCVHDLISQTARSQPDAPAICAWDGECTYGELDRMSTDLAHYLVNQGVERGTIVPLCFEKSMWTSVSILGVMKAGGACVTMETTQPEAHLQRIARLVSGKILLSSAAHMAMAERLAGDQTNVIIPEAFFSQRMGTSNTCLPTVVPSDMIYLNFTSGTTGTPKGVMITHSNFSSALLHQRGPLDVQPKDRVFGYASYAFDASWSITLLTLTTGACLCVPSEEERRGDIAASVRRYGVTYLNLTPSIARLIEPSEVPLVRHINLGGEEVLAEDVIRWGNLQGVVNAYGPSECTPKSLLYNYISESSKLANVIGWGTGLNTWVTQPENPDKLAVIGALGELWLEGPLVGAGYFGDHEKTAATFVENPAWLLSGGPGHSGRPGRLYKTGDLVRYNPNGSLSYTKRKDAQVKVRGQRVELAEIEHHVRDALAFEKGEFSVIAALILPKGGENKILTAFVSTSVAHDTAGKPALGARVSQATEILEERVPSYMIPGAFVFLERMPIGATGKTDRRQLHAIGSSMTLEELTLLGNTGEQGERRAPTTAAELRLQSAWASTLQISAEKLGLDDNFLRIGGDSLLAMRLVGAARREGLSIKYSDIFQKPTLAGLATLATEILTASSDSLEHITPFSILRPGTSFAHIRSHAAAACGVPHDLVQDAFPCTPLQEGLMALSTRREGVYVRRFVLPLKDSIDIGRFRNAWSQTAVAAPILRTRIIDVADQGLVQVVLDEEVTWETKESDLDEYLEKEQDFSVSLGTPLVRYELIRDHNLQRTFFVWTIHHSLYDGWSMYLMMRRAQQLYRGQSLSPIMPFQNFVKRVTIDTVQASAERTWKEYLTGLDAPPFPSTSSTTSQPQCTSMLTHAVSGVQWPRTGITASTAVRAALSVAIMQYTGLDEALFGSVSMGRQIDMFGIDEVVGPTIATVPVRVTSKQEETVAEFLQRIQQQAIQLTAVEQFGLQRIRLLGADAEQACQFQTLLVVQPKSQKNVEDALFESSSKERAAEEPVNEAATFNTYALMMECTLAEDGLLCHMWYDSEIISSDKAQRFCYTFEQAILQLCMPGNDAKRLTNLDLLSPQDVKSIWEWNSTIPESDLSCMHKLISRTICRQPKAAAVCAWDGDLTYEELDCLSTRLAHKLVDRGIGAQGKNVVPLCFEKSMWTPVAMLGVMKAGGASVTLDCNLPEQRLQSIVSQVSPQLILASARQMELAGRLASAPVMIVDASLLEPPSSSLKLDALPTVRPSDVIYIVFTSGSTGTPKGAVMTHRGFSSAIRHQGQQMGYSATSRTYNFVSHSFDVFWHDVLRTFVAGGCLCVPSEDDRMNDLAGSFERLRANSIAIPPSTARLIDPKHVPGLKHLIVGGEPVTAADVSRWKGRVNNIISVYGPAECVPPITIAACDPNSTLAPSLGRGAGVNVWLVDPRDHNKLTAVGATGEALIEGPLVGEGYINNKEVSSKVFIDAPSWLVRTDSGPDNLQRHLYKTGDLLKYNEDGTLSFVARKDAQVKLNGQRFELADVEQNLYHVIGAHSDVQLASEIILPAKQEKKLLVTFVTTASFSRAIDDAGAIKDHRTAWIAALEKRLPKYMIPSAFIPLSEIPKTATGKIDRRRLRALGASMTLEDLNSYSSAGRKRQPPTTAVECLLQQLWASILTIEPSRISANDSFLQIGGDSISAMRLVTAAKQQGLALTVADIFTKPVLHDLASSAKRVMQGNSTRKIEPFSLLTIEEDVVELSKRAAILCGVSASQVQDMFPCTPLQEALIAQTAKHAGDYTARFDLELRSSTNLPRFKRAWESVYDNHPILRTRIIELPGHGLVQVVIEESIRWSYFQTLDEMEMTKEGRSIGLGTSLVQNDLVEEKESGRKYFVWTLHHALYDGWSIPLLMEDLAKAYQGQVLAPSPPFQGFVSYLQERDELTTNVFWETMFQGLEAPSWPVVASTTHQLRADTHFTHTITGISWPRESNITASTILRATLAILIGEYSAASEVLFGATVIGRQAPVESIDRMTGPTITSVPIRIKLPVEQSINELLRDIQKQGIDMMPFEQIGLKRLRRISDDAAQACQFQTLLVVQPRPSSTDDPSRQLFEHSMHTKEATNEDTVNAAFNTYALQVVCDLMDDGIKADFIADSTTIDQTQLRRMAFQFEHILRQLCSLGQGASRVADIETVSTRDRAEIGGWNSKPWTPVKQSVLELLESTSRRKPSATAICAWDGSFTYAELEMLSTKVAYNLVTFGVKPGVVVPILFEKSKWMSIAMTAVIKAGGAGVTLDSSLPENRLRSIVEQVNPKLVVSSPDCEVLAGLLTTERVVLLDDRCVAQLPSPPENYLLPAVTPNDPLYIAFTSGSSGRPKGVVISHGQFSSAIKHQQQGLCITEASRWYEFVSYAWDGIWMHLLFTLAVGACLCVPSETDRRDRIAESMRALQANYVHLTPTVARLLNPSQVPDMKCVGLVGEAMLKSDKDQWTRLGIKVLNLYGPTECTPLSSFAEMGSESEGPLVIGKGFGANLWIVRPQDTSHDLAPIGAVGELVIDGPIVSSGYFSDAVNTAKVFVPSPSWLKQYPRHARENVVYKTGDLARYTSDGNVVLVGRKDSQVKIRGQRVELNDIESHMRTSLTRNAQSAASQEAEISGFADVLIPAESKIPTLVAFLHIHSEEDLSRDELRSVAGQVVPGLVQQLTSSLPAYMVPNFYIPVAQVATTATGKIDRRSLRKMGEQYTLDQLSALNPERGVKRQPVNETEVLIQQLWSQVLNINAENIGSDDSFFQVGGDSVSAMTLAAAAREHGLSLTVPNIFQNPKLEDLAAAAGELVAEDFEMLPFSLLSRGMEEQSVRVQAGRLCKMEPEHIEDVFPCTPMQEGLLAITARRPGAFSACYTFELQTSVDSDRFCRAWTEVLQATPILRTRIIDLPGQGFVQVVAKIPEQWTESDSLDHLRATNLSMTMQLGLPLSLQSFIVEKQTKRRFFIWTVHHALYDGWSRSLVINRLEKAYRSETLGPSPPFQMFAKHLADVNTKRCKSFWQELFSRIEAPSFPSLPTPAYEPQADKSITSVISNIDWPKGDITPSTMVRAAWSILTAEYTGVDEALFGVTVMGRQGVQGIEHMVGPTIATIPVRIVLNKQEPLENLLRGVQQQAVESMEFEQIGLQNLRRISSDTERACQFQTLLLIQPKTLADDTNKTRELFQHSLGDEKAKVANSEDINAAFSSYALQLSCDLGRDDLTLSLVADTSIINEVQLQRIQRQFEHIIRLLCKTKPDAKLGDISITGPHDRQEIWRWNASVPETAAVCVHDLIEKAVKTNDPTKLAINAWNGSITYVELDRLSTRLARRLCSLGVSRGTIVPLCFEKSVWTPVAQVAVMKAGGASVVLDTTTPEQRLLAIIRQVQPLVIVSSTANEQLASRLADATVVTVDMDQLSQLTDSGCALPVVQPSDLLYVVFTSGSTGLPKGALVTHQNFSSAIQHQQHRLGIVSTSRVYDFVSYAFDVAWSNLIQTLTAGACLCIPSESDRRGNIAQSIQDLRANYAHLTPTVARNIDPAAVPGLQTVTLIGEPVSQADIKRWADRRVMLNTYGPAECTPVSTIQDLKITDVGEPRIGKGIGANTWIVRADGSPDLCAIGAVGELVIEGPIVGSGYLSDPAKTARSFIENPPWLLQREDGLKGRSGRVYKTGDLVCYEWDGNLRFIGRRDTQVKIRGQRVELGDIENHLHKHLSVYSDVEVVVDVLCPSGSNNPILVAFICPSGATTISELDLIATVQRMTTGIEPRLRENLPLYMIPNAYVPMPVMPATVTGKRNRTELRRYGQTMTLEQLIALGARQRKRQKPSTQLERQLQEIWASILHVAPDSIGSEDSFFQLGGDSIIAMRLIREASISDLPFTIQDVFTHPRLCDLATLVEKSVSNRAIVGRNEDAALDLRSTQAVTDGDQAKTMLGRPVTSFQTRCIEATLREDKQWLNYCSLDFPPHTPTSQIIDVCKALWDQFDILRTVFIRDQDRYLQKVPPEQQLSYSIEEHDGDINILTRLVCLEDFKEPVILNACFTKFFIIATSAGERKLVLRLSHAQYDGMSLQYLLRYLSSAFQGEVLPDSPRFTDFIDRNMMDTASSDRYWQSLLQDVPMTTIPAPQGPLTFAQVEAIPKASCTREVGFSATHSDMTPATVFTAACACVIAEVTATSDVVFGRLITGRSVLEQALQEVVGPCVNFVPVRVTFDQGDISFKLAQQVVQEQYARSLPYQTTGLGNAEVDPRMTRFGFTVHYLAVDDRPSISLNGSQSRLDFCELPAGYDTGEVEIMAKPSGESLHITVTGGTHRADMLSDVLDRLCTLLHQFSR